MKKWGHGHLFIWVVVAAVAGLEMLRVTDAF